MAKVKGVIFNDTKSFSMAFMKKDVGSEKGRSNKKKN